MTHGDTFNLETRPTEDQRARVHRFLTELLLISAKYGILIDTYVDGETPMLLDITTDTIVGLDLLYSAEGEQVLAYACTDSILDGAWPVDFGTGEVRQMHEPKAWAADKDVAYARQPPLTSPKGPATSPKGADAPAAALARARRR